MMKDQEDIDNCQSLDADNSYGGVSMSDNADESGEDDENSEYSSSLDPAPRPPCIVDLKTRGWDDDAISKCFEFAIRYGDSAHAQYTFEPVVNKSLNDVYSNQAESVEDLERIKGNEKESSQGHRGDNESSYSFQNSNQTESGTVILPLPGWAL
jgi:hypothetical protein